MYKIGIISRFLGIPEHVLRFYEKKGLIHAKRREGSPTRYFDAFDINRLVMAKRFRGLEFSIEELQSLFALEERGEEVDYYGEFTKKYQATTEALARLELVQQELARLKDALYLHERSRKETQRWSLPTLYWNYDMDKFRSPESFSIDGEAGEIIMKRIYPAVYMMAMVEGEDAALGEGPLDYSWGTAFSAQHLHLFPERLRRELRCIPAGAYRVRGYVENQQCMLTRERIEPLLPKGREPSRRPLLVELLPGGKTLYFMPEN